MGYIVWLASYPKSGNTWLRTFLSNLLNRRAAADINALAEEFPYDIGGRFYQALDPRPCNEYSRAETLALRPQVQRMIADQNPHVTFVKTHSALVIEDGYQLIDPSLTVAAVYIVRNPLDVAVSFSSHRGKSIDDTIDLMAMEGAVEVGSENAAQEFFGSWSQNVESWTRTGSRAILPVRYEDMISSPRKTFSRIATFLGIGTSRERLDRAIRLSSFRVLKSQEQRAGFNERPQSAAAPFFRKGEAGEGLKLLSTEQINRIVSAHRSHMERFGYMP
jgi:hypothetical protein